VIFLSPLPALGIVNRQFPKRGRAATVEGAFDDLGKKLPVLIGVRAEMIPKPPIGDSDFNKIGHSVGPDNRSTIHDK
jgi:hypothetical protein